MGGDFDSNIAHYCIHKLKWKPSTYDSMPIQEKAFIAASIQIKIDEEKKEAKELKRKNKQR